MANVLPPAPDPLEGRIVGSKYELERFVRGDDLGRIYRGQHIALERKVSVRVLHGSHLEDQQLIERFRRAGVAAARIRHPNIVDVLDFGQQKDGSLYMVFEHIEGRNLRELVAAERALPPDRVVDITMQIAAGMAVAHAAGVVHRDIKPENVIVFVEDTDDGDISERVKILNFGVAKIEQPLTAPRRLKTIEMVQGDPAFMSPEQCNGMALDARSDLYGIGCLAYYLATGQPPFEGSTLDVLVKHVKDAPIPPSRLNSDIPTDLDAVILRALGKKPEQRYASGRELRRALQSLNVARPTPSAQIEIDIDEESERTKPKIDVPPDAIAPTTEQPTPVRKKKASPPPPPSAHAAGAGGHDGDDERTNPIVQSLALEAEAAGDPFGATAPTSGPRPPPGQNKERFRSTLVIERDADTLAVRRRKPVTLLVVAVVAAIVVGIVGGLLAGRAISSDPPAARSD